MAARWALRGLHQSLCLDLAGTGVQSCEVVFAKVKSGYFINNPGSEEHLPGIAQLVPELTPEQCAEVIYKLIQNPKSSFIYPFMLRMFYLLNYFFPGLVRLLAIRTGRRH
jgi:NADP-dependent 3-hydroxy acid dehydrogenase YdfG